MQGRSCAKTDYLAENSVENKNDDNVELRVCGLNAMNLLRVDEFTTFIIEHYYIYCKIH